MWVHNVLDNTFPLSTYDHNYIKGMPYNRIYVSTFEVYRYDTPMSKGYSLKFIILLHLHVDLHLCYFILLLYYY